jgi:hypothetical protein
MGGGGRRGLEMRSDYLRRRWTFCWDLIGTHSEKSCIWAGFRERPYTYIYGDLLGTCSETSST